MKIHAVPLIALSLLACGCETFNDSYRRRDDYLAARQAAEAPRAQDQQLAQLSASVAALNASNAEIVRHINEINQKIAALQQNDATMQGAVNSIRQDMEATRKSWQTANEKMIDQISSEMNKAIKTPSSGGKSGGPVGTGDFYVHTVEAGNTLNAIAKAYEVTAAEIRAANGMSNDLIRVGQKLYVPKK